MYLTGFEGLSPPSAPPRTLNEPSSIAAYACRAWRVGADAGCGMGVHALPCQSAWRRTSRVETAPLRTASPCRTLVAGAASKHACRALQPSRAVPHVAQRYPQLINERLPGRLPTARTGAATAAATAAGPRSCVLRGERLVQGFVVLQLVLGGAVPVIWRFGASWGPGVFRLCSECWVLQLETVAERASLPQPRCSRNPPNNCSEIFGLACPERPPPAALPGLTGRLDGPEAFPAPPT
jgi:hypothetical protein